MAWIFEAYSIVLFFIIGLMMMVSINFFHVGIDYWTNQIKKKREKNIVICI